MSDRRLTFWLIAGGALGLWAFYLSGDQINYHDGTGWHHNHLDGAAFVGLLAAICWLMPLLASSRARRKRGAQPTFAQLSDDEQELLHLKKELREVEKGSTFWAVMSIILFFAFFPWSLLFGGVLSRDSAWRTGRAEGLKAEIERLEALAPIASPDVRAEQIVREAEELAELERSTHCTACGECRNWQRAWRSGEMGNTPCPGCGHHSLVPGLSPTALERCWFSPDAYALLKAHGYNVRHRGW